MNHDADKAIAALRLIDKPDRRLNSVCRARCLDRRRMDRRSLEPHKIAIEIAIDTIKEMDRELNRLLFIEAQFETCSRKLTMLQIANRQRANGVPRGTIADRIKGFFTDWKKQSPNSNR